MMNNLFQHSIVGVCVGIALSGCGAKPIPAGPATMLDASPADHDNVSAITRLSFVSMIQEKARDVESIVCRDAQYLESLAEAFQENQGYEIIPVACQDALAKIKPVWSSLPPLLTSNPELETILVAKNLKSFGLVLPIGGSGSVLFLNEEVLYSSLNDLENKKMAKTFNGKILASHVYPNGLESGLTYVLTHELAHVLDATFHLTGATLASSGIFDQASWLNLLESKFDKTVFPKRELLQFYSPASSLENDAKEIVDEWNTTSFLSLYASASPYEDFAETAAMHLLEGAGWSFKYKVADETVDLNARMTRDDFRWKRCFISKLNGSNASCLGKPDEDEIPTATAVSSVTEKADWAFHKTMRFGGGTAFFISAHHFVTNHHVVKHMGSGVCEFPESHCPTSDLRKRFGLADDVQIEIRPIYIREDADVAVLEVKGFTFADYFKVKVSGSCADAPQRVFSVGYPGFGQLDGRGLLTTGSSISGCNDARSFAKMGLWSLIGAPGSSGSPVIAEDGQVIGQIRGQLGRQIPTGSAFGNLNARSGVFDYIAGVTDVGSFRLNVEHEVKTLLTQFDSEIDAMTARLEKLNSAWVNPDDFANVSLGKQNDLRTAVTRASEAVTTALTYLTSSAYGAAELQADGGEPMPKQLLCEKAKRLILVTSSADLSLEVRTYLNYTLLPNAFDELGTLDFFKKKADCDLNI